MILPTTLYCKIEESSDEPFLSASDTVEGLVEEDVTAIGIYKLVRIDKWQMVAELLEGKETKNGKTRKGK